RYLSSSPSSASSPDPPKEPSNFARSEQYHSLSKIR
ncbi:hypothetical protein L195_g049646, partial [Trifolium pratense]